MSVHINPKQHKIDRVTSAAPMRVLVLVLFILDLFPSHGPPSFRYTGSNPNVAVWNLGWPLPLFIYDSTQGFHVGPFAYIILPGQALLIVFSVWRMLSKRRRQRGQE